MSVLADITVPTLVLRNSFNDTVGNVADNRYRERLIRGV
jgi:hypothetical protein